MPLRRIGLSSAVGHGHDSTPTPLWNLCWKNVWSRNKCVGVLPPPPPPAPAERPFTGLAQDCMARAAVARLLAILPPPPPPLSKHPGAAPDRHIVLKAYNLTNCFKKYWKYPVEVITSPWQARTRSPQCCSNGFKDVANSERVFTSRDRAFILRNALAPARVVHLTCNACLFCLLLSFPGSLRINNYVRPVLYKTNNALIIHALVAVQLDFGDLQYFANRIVNVLHACCTAANAWRNVYY